MFDSDQVSIADGVATVRIVDRETLARLASVLGLKRPLPYVLSVENESPAPRGIEPAALPTDIPNNHFVYALTWFAFAGMLVIFYGALVWRRMRTP